MNHLTESDWRKVDFDVLTHGYIRQRICVFGLKPSETPGNVVDLCRDFAAPQIFENEAADPVNQVSPEDEKESDRYKEEGNRHFQAKEFEDAIIKYTTAIRFNANNHLVFSNRASSYFMKMDYVNAKNDIMECLRIDPSFIKGWFRFGLILEQLRDYKRAGVAYKTASQLSEDKIGTAPTMAKNRRTSLLQYQSKYSKFLKALKGKTHGKAIKRFIITFGEEWDDMREWKEMNEAMGKRDPEIADLQRRSRNGENVQDELKWKAQSAPEYVQFMEDQQFRLKVMRSRFEHFAHSGVLKFTENRDDFIWNENFTSISLFSHHKRLWKLQIISEHNPMLPIFESIVHGRPNAKQMLNALYQGMACSADGRKCIKPKVIKCPYRMFMEYALINTLMGVLGIQCILVSREEALASCHRYGTDLMGYNHLD